MRRGIASIWSGKGIPQDALPSNRCMLLSHKKAIWFYTYDKVLNLCAKKKKEKRKIIKPQKTQETNIEWQLFCCFSTPAGFVLLLFVLDIRVIVSKMQNPAFPLYLCMQDVVSLVLPTHNMKKIPLFFYTYHSISVLIVGPHHAKKKEKKTAQPPTRAATPPLG